MTQIIPFEAAALSTNVASLFKIERLGSVPSSSFPVISIKGKVFTKVIGDERTLITKPDGDGEPASSIEVVIVNRNPNRSKVYYDTGYVEGTDAKPTCYSNNGIQPEADAQSPQAKKCATCAHNQWGSRVTEQGSKAKACADSQRLAVAPVGMVNDPMLIRVPATSLKALDQFGDAIVKRNLPYQMVAVKIGFDYTVAHPALTFKPIGIIDEATAMQVAEVAQSDVVQQIIGIMPVPHEEAEDNNPLPVVSAAAGFATAPVEAAPPIQKPAQKAAAPKAAPVITPEVVEQAAPAPTPAPAAKPAPVVVEASGLESEIADVMAGLDFDDM